MEKSRTLLSYHDLTVEVETAPGDELIEHMHSTILGQPGGLRYQHTNIMERLIDPGENYFMYLRKKGRMIGSVGFCGKQGQTGGITYDAWLIRYFSIKAPMRSVPTSRMERSDRGEEEKRSSVLGRFIQPVFRNPSMIREGSKGQGEPAIIYAIIDQTNLRSMNFSEQMGMETVSEMVSFTFSRFRPGRSGRMEQLAEPDHEAMLGILNDYYRDYNLFFSNPLFKNDDYYVIRESGKIVAGIQVYRITWRVVDFGGGMTSRIVGFLTRFTWFRKRIDPDNLRLLAFDGIYCEEGREEVLYELLEGVLERTGIYMGMFMIDEKAHILKLFEGGKLGILHRILGWFRADIRARFLNLPETAIAEFRSRPTYVPTYDNS